MMYSPFLSLAFTLLSAPFAFVSADGRQSFPGGFTCDRFDEIALEGFGLFVDTNGDGTVTTGDLSIAAYSNKFVPAGLPIYSDNFEVSQISIQAVCTLLVDGSTPQAPSCQLELDIAYCKIPTPAEPEPEPVGRNLREASDSEKDVEGKNGSDPTRKLQLVPTCTAVETGKIMATGNERYAFDLDVNCVFVFYEQPHATMTSRFLH